MIARARLRFALLGGGQLQRGVCGDGACGLQHCRRGFLLIRNREDRFVVERRLRAFGGGRCRFARAEAREVKHVWKKYLHAGCPIGAFEREALHAAVERAARLGAASSAEEARLKVHAGKVRAT